MILAFFVLMLVTAFGLAFMTLSTSSVLTSKRDVIRARAMSCAEAGVDKAISFLMTGGPNGEATGEWRTTHPSTNPNDHSADTLYTESMAAGESFSLCVRDGSGVTAGKVVITSTGTAIYGSATISRTVKVVVDYSKENVCPWNNAIFGGVGQSGKSINGNVKIMGSVHLLGDGEEFTDLDGDGRWDDNEPYTDSNHDGQYNLGEPYVDIDGDGHRDSKEPFLDVNGNGLREPALTVTDLAYETNGAATLGNNYAAMPAGLRSLVPNPPQDVFGGELIDTLEAKLRVKHGKVNISGSASVGNSNVAGNTYKETVNGTYVSDGFGGNAGTGAVHSDNGFANGYDLGDGVVKFPVLDLLPFTKDGITYPSYMNYLALNSTIVVGDVNIQKGTPLTISGPKGSLSVDASGNMTIDGIVYVTGNISFGPSKSKIIYDGHGTLVTPNSVFVHCDILPKTNFPISDAMGLVARDRIELATGGGDAQLTMALAMYAQHKIISNKQSEIAGTMVASYYQMSNVPRLYQVPELANNLPPGMPGGDPIWIAGVSIESWQEM